MWFNMLQTAGGRSVYLLLSSLTPVAMQGQIVPKVIGGEATCPQCRIERYLLATINDSTFAGGALVRAGEIHGNKDLTFLVTAGAESDELYVADRMGRITRRIGRKGEGPGEFLRPSYVMETPTAYLVVDQTIGRVTPLSKRTLEVSGTITRLPGDPISRPVAFKDGSYVLRAEIPTRERAGYALHFVGSDGRVIRSFSRPEATTGAADARPTLLAVSGDSAIWAAYLDRYRIEKWDKRGNLLAVYERKADWFRPRREPPSPGPYMRLSSIHEDDRGRLWVHIVIRTLRETTRMGERGRRTALAPDPDPLLSESIVEVLDPASARLVASTRITGWRAASISGGFYHLDMIDRSSGSGEPLLKVWGFRMRPGVD